MAAHEPKVIAAPGRLTVAVATAVAVAALRAAGVPDAAARDIAEALTDVSLRGIDTHGLRLLPQYLDERAQGIATARVPSWSSRDGAPAPPA
jgi:ureidoglycolate dehydrogenase (NAD+)